MKLCETVEKDETVSSFTLLPLTENTDSSVSLSGLSVFLYLPHRVWLEGGLVLGKAALCVYAVHSGKFSNPLTYSTFCYITALF